MWANSLLFIERLKVTLDIKINLYSKFVVKNNNPNYILIMLLLFEDRKLPTSKPDLLTTTPTPHF